MVALVGLLPYKASSIAIRGMFDPHQRQSARPDPGRRVVTSAGGGGRCPHSMEWRHRTPPRAFWQRATALCLKIVTEEGLTIDVYEPDCCVMSSSFPPTHPTKEERRPKDGVVKENQAEGNANGGVQQLTRTQAAGGFRGSAGDGRGRSRRFSNSRSGGREGRGDGAGDAGGGGSGGGRPRHTARGERERQHQQAASNPAQQARESSGQRESQDATAQPAAPRRAGGEAAAAGEAQTTSSFGDKGGERAKGGWGGESGGAGGGWWN